MELQLQSKDLLSFVKGNPHLSSLVDREGRYVMVSDSLARVLGCPSEEIIGRKFEEFLPEKVCQQFRSALTEVRTFGNPVQKEETVSVDGLERHYMTWLYPVRTNDTGIDLIAVQSIDISTAKRSQEEARQRHELLLAVLNGMDALVYVADLETYEILFVNEYGQQIWGNVVGEKCWRVFQDEVEPCALCANSTLLTENGEPSACYGSERQITAHRRWYDGRVRAIRWVDGRVVRLKTAMDVTQEKLAEEALQRREQDIEAILLSIGDAVIATDDDGSVTHMNHVAEELTGWPMAEATGKPLRDVFYIINSQTRRRTEDPVAEVLRHRKRVGLANHTAIVSRDGVERQIADSAAPVVDSDGRTQGVVLVFRDVTEEYELREKVRVSEEQFRSLFENSSDAVAIHELILDDEGRPVDYVLLEANRAFEDHTALRVQDILGKRVTEIHPGVENTPLIGTYGRVVLTGEPTTFEYSFDLVGRYYSINAFKVGEMRFAVVFRDITARKRAEARARDAADRTERQRSAFAVFSSERSIHSGDLATAKKVITEAAAEAMQTERVSIWMVSEDACKLECIDLHERSAQTHSEGFELNVSEQGAYLEALQAMSPVVATDAVSSPFTRELASVYLNPAGISSLLDAGILVDGKLAAVLSFEHVGAGRTWLPDEESFASGVASVVANVLFNAERRRFEEEVRRKQRLLEATQEMAHLGSWELDLNTNQLVWSDEVYRIFGLQPQQFAPNYGAFLEFVHPEDREDVNRAYAESVQHGRDGYEIEHRIIRSGTEETRHIHEKCMHVKDSTGTVIRSVGMVHDITERKEAENRLRHSEEKYRAFAEQSMEGVYMHDLEGNILEANPAASAMSGYTQEELLELTVFDLHREDEDSDIDDVRQKLLGYWRSWSVGESVVTDAEHQRKDGTRFPVEIQTGKIAFGGDEYILALVRDVTERKRAMDRIQYLSFHDSLTGLYNRRFFDEELRRLDVPRNLPLTLLILDVDGLKLTNDAFGHRAGDELLTKVGRSIRQACRADDIVSRIGGDEFAVVLARSAESQVHALKGRIQQAIAAETVEGLPISVSCGWAIKTGPAVSMEEVFKTAEDDMYRNKVFNRDSHRHQSVHLIMQTLHAASPREQRHSERVSQLCRGMGRAMELEVDGLGTAGMLHDIGKIATDKRVLNKRGSLNQSEWREIQRHPEVGYSILSAVNDYAPLAEYVLAHHERWDGAGYPNGLKGTDIPRMARIIAVADAYDAMTTARPYRQAMSHADALLEIQRCSGSQFDPDIVRVFLEMMNSGGTDLVEEP